MYDYTYDLCDYTDDKTIKKGFVKLYITDYTIYIGHHLRLSIIRMKCPSFWFQLSQFSSR